MKKRRLAIGILVSALLGVSLAGSAATAAFAAGQEGSLLLRKSRNRGGETAAPAAKGTVEEETPQGDEDSFPAKDEAHTYVIDGSFEPIDMIDDDNALVRVTDLTANSSEGLRLHVYFENHFSKMIRIYVDHCTINGKKVTAYQMQDLSKGTSTSGSIKWSADELYETVGSYSVEDIHEMVITWHVVDITNFDEFQPVLTDETFWLYPNGAEGAGSGSAGKSSAASGKASGAGGKFTDEIVLEETVLIDNDEFRLSATGCEYNDIDGLKLDLRLENPGSKAMTYQVAKTYINALGCNGLCLKELEPGEKVDANVKWRPQELAKGGLDGAGTIELIWNYHEKGVYKLDAMKNATVCVFPYGEEAAAVYEREPQEKDVTVADGELCGITVVGFGSTYFNDPFLRVYLENRSDKELMFTLKKAKVNGVDCDPFWTRSLDPGKKLYVDITWMDSVLVSSGIVSGEKFETITLPFEVYEKENMFGGSLTSATGEVEVSELAEVTQN